MDTSSATLPFSVENFVKLFEVSESKKYLSEREREQIYMAIQQKDVPLLQNLYESLLAEQKVDKAIVTNFLVKKQKLMDNASIQSQQIYNDYVVKPQQDQRVSAEEQEKNTADTLLDDLPIN